MTNFGEHLAYVGIVVSDPEAAATMFEQTFGLTRSQLSLPGAGSVPMLHVGRSALALFDRGHKLADGETRTGVHHIALGVADVEAAAGQAAEAGLDIESAGGGDIDQLGRTLLSVQQTGGIRTYLVEEVEHLGNDSMVQRIDHLGIMGSDNAAARAVFCDALGCELQGEQVDTEIRTSTEHFVYTRDGNVNTVVYNRPAEFVASVHDLFITVGDCELEIIQSLDPHDDAMGAPGPGGSGTLKLDHNAVTSFIAKRGPGLHHVAFKVDDIDRRLAHLRSSGLELIDDTGRPGARGSRIGFMKLATTFGVLLHLVERDENLGSDGQSARLVGSAS